MSRWMSMELHLEHDGEVEALQFMEDLTDLVASIVAEVCEGTPYDAPYLSATLSGDTPEGYEDCDDDA